MVQNPARFPITMKYENVSLVSGVSGGRHFTVDLVASVRVGVSERGPGVRAGRPLRRAHLGRTLRALGLRALERQRLGSLNPVRN